jgi:AraC-like DNA-binding protein
MAYMEHHMGDEISLNNLCKACHISARTLQVAFQTIRGRTPLQALQEIRLTQLKQLLLAKIEIREACAQVGLPPSGRMAANYKRLFGELPSQTRQRAGYGINRANDS